MIYKEFLTLLTERLQKRFDSTCHFIPNEVVKTNGTTEHTLFIKNKNSNVFPGICLDSCYLDYIAGRAKLNDIVETIFQIYQKSSISGDIDIDLFMDWNKAKHEMRCKLINTEMNIEMLAEMPHREILDLSVVYYLHITMPGGIEGNVHIRNEHVKLWDTDENSLYAEAWKNMNNAGDASIDSMINIIGSIMEQEENIYADELNEKMYVVSSRSRTYGAIHMFNTEKIMKVAEDICSDLWILPSSIHEVILIPCNRNDNEAELDKIICEMNSTELSDDEILSFHAYHFSRNTGKISMAS